MSVTLENLGIDQLSEDAQWELLGLIWDKLAERPRAIPNSHVEELERRIESANLAPDDVVAWDEARTRLMGGL